VERFAYLHWARSLASHQLHNYLQGLLRAAAHVPDQGWDQATGAEAPGSGGALRVGYEPPDLLASLPQSAIAAPTGHS
jgi:hypothetical protein